MFFSMVSARICSHSSSVRRTAQLLTALETKALSTDSLVERRIDVKGVAVNYVKAGIGPHHILCTPGVLGSVWIDFKRQVEHIDRSKFTVVAWDPPGYGNSYPPERDFSPGFLYRDADFGMKLMKELNIPRYSLLGCGNGGTSSLIMAALYPKNIIKLVVWACNSCITEEDVFLYEEFRHHSFIPPTLKEQHIKVYGEVKFNELWDQWTDASIAVYNSSTKGDICRSLLPKISCPTLVLHGSKDITIATQHGQYLADNIKNAKYHILEEGKHYLQLQLWKDFNWIVESFLQNNENH